MREEPASLGGVRVAETLGQHSPTPGGKAVRRSGDDLLAPWGANSLSRLGSSPHSTLDIVGPHRTICTLTESYVKVESPSQHCKSNHCVQLKKKKKFQTRNVMGPLPGCSLLVCGLAGGASTCRTSHLRPFPAPSFNAPGLHQEVGVPGGLPGGHSTTQHHEANTRSLKATRVPAPDRTRALSLMEESMP